MSWIAGKRILVVDDENDVCETVVELLSECQVDTANTYEAARAKLDVGPYDAVILDVMGVRGMELLQEFAPHYRCIMLSARKVGLKHVNAAIEAGARLYLLKSQLPEIEACLDELFSQDSQGIQRFLNKVRDSKGDSKDDSKDA